MSLCTHTNTSYCNLEKLSNILLSTQTVPGAGLFEDPTLDHVKDISFFVTGIEGLMLLIVLVQ